MKEVKKYLFLLVVLSVGFVLGSVMVEKVLAVGTWTAAPASPPNSNVDAPINVGSDAQYKSGAIGIGLETLRNTSAKLDVMGLGLFSNLSTNSLQVTGGSPTAGKVLTAVGPDGTATWSDAGTGSGGGTGSGTGATCGWYTMTDSDGTTPITEFLANGGTGVCRVSYTKNSISSIAYGYMGAIYEDYGGYNNQVSRSLTCMSAGASSVTGGTIQSGGSASNWLLNAQLRRLTTYEYYGCKGGGSSSIEYVKCYGGNNNPASNCTARCSVGKKVIGGGCWVSQGIGQSSPLDDGTGWQCGGQVADVSYTQVVGTAICQ